MTKKITVIAGEASGDLHGSNLIKEMRAASTEPLEIHGVGGDKIRQTGALSFYDLAHFHVTGFTEVLKHIPQYAEAEKVILSQIQKTRPDLVVLIDNPGFNLHLAKKIHALNIPIIYYISPQIWAWAPKRVLKIKAYVQKVLVVFEFEKKIYEEHRVPVTWVGHPLKDLLETVREKKLGSPTIALLPGSRKGELKMLFSILARSAAKIAEKMPSAVFAVIKAPTLSRKFYEELIQKEFRGLHCTLVEEDAYAVIKGSDLAIVCSGTATLECALLGAPMIVVNKGSFLTYVAAKMLARVKYLGLPNLILGKQGFPELLQYDATPDKIFQAAMKILSDDVLRRSMKQDLEEVSKRVGGLGASRRAAQEILSAL